MSTLFYIENQNEDALTTDEKFDSDSNELFVFNTEEDAMDWIKMHQKENEQLSIKTLTLC